MRSRSSPSPSAPLRDAPSPPPQSDSKTKTSGALLWLICVVFLLGANPFWMSKTASLLVPPADCVLTPAAAWTPPLSRSEALIAWAECPYWLFAVLTASVIWSACLLLGRETSVWPVALFLVGASLGIEPRDVLPAAIMIVAAQVVSADRFKARPFLAMSALTLCLAVAVLVTIEFGLVLISLVLVCLPPLLQSTTIRPRSRLLVASMMMVLLGTAVVLNRLNPGFMAALLRPINWIWHEPPAELLSSLSFAIDPSHPLLANSLLMLFLVSCWLRLFGRASVSPLTLFAAVLLSFIGLGGGRYLLLCSFAMAMVPVRVSTHRPQARVDRLVLAGLLVVGVGRLATHAGSLSLDSAGSPQRVDATQWGTSGSVLLMNLDHTTDWQSTNSRRSFRLFLDDRWDVFGDEYPAYAAMCRDMGEVRDVAYRRTDGEWGGYRRFFYDASPTLLVVDSADLQAIRRLSLSPHWSVMGIDACRTIFGNPELSENRNQLRRASATLSELEWPSQTPVELNPQVIISTDLESDRQIAEILNGLRLPYAALRLLPSDESWATKRCKARSFLELAHRVRRHSGQASLLDQYRAIVSLKEVQQHSLWSKDERNHIGRSLEGLGVPELISEFVDAEADVAGDLPPTASANITQDLELQVRNALRRGDPSRCAQLIPSLDPELRDYYNVLASAHRKSAVELYRDLNSAIHLQNFPHKLAAEAWFYLGCLSIEAGHPDKTLEALLRSTELDQDSPFADLRQFYLAQTAN